MHRSINRKSFIVIIFLLTITLTSSSWIKESSSIKFESPNSLLVNFYLDTLTPGNIMLRQLSSIKEFKAKSILANGKTQELKVASFILSFTFAKSRNGASSTFVQMTGGRLHNDAISLILTSKPGDLIMIGNIKLEGVTTFKTPESPMWKVVENK